jgi:hypothetical protein
MQETNSAADGQASLNAVPNNLPLQGPVTGPPRPAVPQGPGPYATPAMLAAQGVPGNAMVLLRAPNGQTQQVPADHAEYYVARGATRV